MIATMIQTAAVISVIFVHKLMATIGDIRVIIIFLLFIKLFRYSCIILIFFIKSSDFSFPVVSQSRVKPAKTIFS